MQGLTENTFSQSASIHTNPSPASSGTKQSRFSLLEAVIQMESRGKRNPGSVTWLIAGHKSPQLLLAHCEVDSLQVQLVLSLAASTSHTAFTTIPIWFKSKSLVLIITLTKSERNIFTNMQKSPQHLESEVFPFKELSTGMSVLAVICDR